MSMNAWTLTQEQASNFGMLDPLKLENKKKKSNRFAGMDIDGDNDNSAEEGEDDDAMEEDDEDAIKESGPKKKRQDGIVININLGTPKPSKDKQELQMSRRNQYSNFNFLSKMVGKGKAAANVAADVPSKLLGPRTVSGAAGAVAGGALGQLAGTATGMYKGATYNPDIIDPETEEKRKLGLAARAGLVLGGSSLGSLGGRLLGTGAGAIAGAAIPSKLGADIADNIYKTTTTSMSRYPGAPVASFKHDVYRKAS